MSEPVTLKLTEEYTFTLPLEIVRKYHLQKGMELFLLDEDGILVLLPKKEMSVWDELRQAIADLRRSVKARGGITQAEIEAAIHKARTIRV
ncbi:MAG: AbrB/MazE/SpoVT family DNA-binding domain-containing protein [candidate division KSB1 bacterium]|nr:AbrB/MazE/SpoVT family DNA-binding domain-containing protein [candidate division KSB1 bacterium]